MIVGVGLNTNSSPNIKNYKAISLSVILKKKIDNNVILKKIRNEYERFIHQSNMYNFNELKKKLLRIWII